MEVPSQYEEVSQRINRLLQEAAQRGHIQSTRQSSGGTKSADPDQQEHASVGRGVSQTAFLTPREVAGMLNLSTDTVYTMLREGELPAIRLGAGKRQVWRIPLIELRRFLDAKRTGPSV
jgi:excisionase family DNA binding protein